MSDTGKASENRGGSDGNSLGAGVGMLVAAAALFGVCSLVQHAYGSSMFATSYADPGFVGSLLINLTYWPGWLGTVLLAGLGLLGIVAGLSKS